MQYDRMQDDHSNVHGGEWGNHQWMRQWQREWGRAAKIATDSLTGPHGPRMPTSRPTSEGVERPDTDVDHMAARDPS